MKLHDQAKALRAALAMALRELDRETERLRRRADITGWAPENRSDWDVQRYRDGLAEGLAALDRIRRELLDSAGDEMAEAVRLDAARLLKLEDWRAEVAGRISRYVDGGATPEEASRWAVQALAQYHPDYVEGCNPESLAA